MTENMKKFLETASADKEFVERLNESKDEEAVIALAKEKGFTLTKEDLNQQEKKSGALSEDELDAVAGGKACYCAVAGGGEEGEFDDTCGCFGVGSGSEKGITSARCFCMIGGHGMEM